VRRIAFLGLALLAVGCGGASENASERELEAGTLRLGFVGRLTGAPWDRDRLAFEGARLAVGEINRLGGIDGVLRLRLDGAAAATPAGAMTAAEGLLRRGARVLVTPCRQAEQLSVFRAGESARRLVLGTCNRGLGRAGRPGTDWYVSPELVAQAAALAELVAERGHERVWLDAPRSGETRTTLEAALRERGLRAVRRGGKPDAVVVARNARETVRLIASLRADGSRAAIFALDQLDSARVRGQAGSLLEGASFTAYGYPVPGSELDELYERYRARYGRRPDGSAIALGYTAVKVLEAAINVYESAETARVQRAMRGLEHHGGPLGSIAYPERGGRSPRAEVPVVTVVDSRLELARRAEP